MCIFKYCVGWGRRVHALLYSGTVFTMKYTQIVIMFLYCLTFSFVKGSFGWNEMFWGFYFLLHQFSILFCLPKLFIIIYTERRSWREDPKYHKETVCLRVKSWKQLENVKMTYMFFSYKKPKHNCFKFLNFSMIKNACLAVFKHTHTLKMSQCKRGIF